MGTLTATQEQFIREVMAEAQQLSDRELLEQIYARLRLVDAFIENARSNPMLAAMMG